jgi:hypothetical protein
VTLSFSLDDMPDVLANADVPFVPGHSEHAIPIEPQPEQFAAPQSTMPENPPAGIYSTSNGTSKPRVNGTPAPEPAPSTSSATADIVGSLISRALTFRIK